MSWINFGLAFIEGLALIASPCILPVLPLVLSTSIEGGRSRPLGIITGFILSFCLFAFFSRWVVQAIGIDLAYIKYGSLILLGLFGLVLLSPRLSNKFAQWTQGFANVGSQLSSGQEGGFVSGLGIGALIGLIWTPCAGPILAAVLVQIIREQNNIQGLITMAFFAIGAGIPMLLIAWMGRSIVNRLGFFKQHAERCRQLLGVIILASVAFIASGIDPQTFFSRSSSGANMTTLQKNPNLINPLLRSYDAPAISGIQAWLNSEPLDLQSLKGKVVLIDFWTYSCINCVRTLPYVTGWDQKYRDKGLVVIGVHAPEFEFEKNVDNIKRAIAKNNIHYPVAVDSMLSTWSNYNNRYWPAQYLINKEGKVVYTHFGEGDDEITEHNINVLLGMGGIGVNMTEEAPPFHIGQTPETYLGSARAERFSGMNVVNPPSNHWSLEGQWKIESEKIISENPNAVLRLHFNAQKVFLVMGTSTGKPISVSLTLNGKPVGTPLTVDQHTLYPLIDQKDFQSGILEIKVSEPGLEMYAFTFG